MQVKRGNSERPPDAFETVAIMFKAGAPLMHCLVALAPVPGRKRHIERYAQFRHEVLRAKQRIIEIMRSRNRHILGDREIPLHTTDHIRRAWLQPDRKAIVQSIAQDVDTLLTQVQEVDDAANRLAFHQALRELGKAGLLMDAPSDAMLGGDSLILVHRPRYPTYPIDLLTPLLPKVDYRRKYHDLKQATSKGVDRTYRMD